jgi:hypothetical protein
MPAAFFLPPQSNEALKENIRLLAGCTAFIAILGVIVALTQGIVVSV